MNDEQFWHTMDGVGSGSKDGMIDQKEFVTFVTDIWSSAVKDREYLEKLFDKIKAPKSDIMTYQDIVGALKEETIVEDFKELADRYIGRQNRCAQRAGGIAGRGVLGRREGGREGRKEGGAGDSAQRAARSAQGLGWMLWNSVER